MVASVADYIQEADHVAELYTEIQQCDGILEKMQTMLSGFQVQQIRSRTLYYFYTITRIPLCVASQRHIFYRTFKFCLG